IAKERPGTVRTGRIDRDDRQRRRLLDAQRRETCDQRALADARRTGYADARCRRGVARGLAQQFVVVHPRDARQRAADGAAIEGRRRRPYVAFAGAAGPCSPSSGGRLKSASASKILTGLPTTRNVPSSCGISATIPRAATCSLAS